jgi:Ca2+/H+ antiporter, TMEM165/GDT1 family
VSWEAFAVSTGSVALGEVGDKTQLLALLLAARYQQPLTIVAGIAVATVANHALAVAVGLAVADLVAPGTLRWLLAASFIAVGLWMLKPDQAEDSGIAERSRWGVFGITVVAFFLAEMGDKTQLATVMLAAHYAAPLAVGLGTTLGMLLANVPVVWLGERVLRRVPMAWVHRVAAAVFITLGVAIAWGFGPVTAAGTLTAPTLPMRTT